MADHMSTVDTLPADAYYRSGGRKVPLTPVPATVAVRFRRQLRSTASERLARAERLFFLPGHGVEIVRLAEEADARFIEEDDDVDFVSPLFRTDEDSDAVVFTTRKVIAQFGADVERATIERLASARRARVVGPGPLPGSWVLEAPSASGLHGAIALANLLVEEGHAKRASPDLVHEIEKRPVFLDTDPAGAAAGARRAERGEGEMVVIQDRDLRDNQWHLDVANVPAAWEHTRGSGVSIAILDDGVDTGHVEFLDRIDAERDFEFGSDDGSPKTAADRHGTACAGVAAAAGVAAIGVAPECRLVVGRTPVGLGTIEEIEMWTWVGERADVVSCSWGPNQPYLLPEMTEEALRALAEDARRGLGVPIFFAAGNETEDMATDGYAANPHVVAVGASTNTDEIAHYSDFGSELDIVAPSSSRTVKITTTDRTGEDGYSTSDYTTTFGGTSSATPLVAGVAALMLAVNPGLSAADLRHLLLTTTDRIGDPDDYVNGHSTTFGFGRVNAGAAVAAAADPPQGGGNSSTPSVRGPDRVSSDGPPPTFEVDLAGNRFYSVEVTTEARLFDEATDGSERTDENFTSTFRQDGVLATAPAWPLGEHAWSVMRHAERLHYRMLSSRDEFGQDGFHITVEDGDFDAAPFVSVTGSAPSEDPGGLGGGGGGTGTGDEVEFPSGARFAVVEDPEDGLDYSDPVTGGSVALLEVEGRLDERLSTNFTVRELMAGLTPPTRYARISPDFVNALQRLRDAAGAALTIRSAYRPPAKNEAVEGAEKSQHLVGRAADLRIAGFTPLEVAALALETLGAGIGLGLGRNTIHLDTRGVLTSWAYDGAELDEVEFDGWVRAKAKELGLRSRAARRSAEERGAPTVRTAAAWHVGEEPPVFHVWAGSNPFVAIDLVTDVRLFETEAGRRDDTNSYGGWETGLVETAGSHAVLLSVPADRWSRLAAADRVFFRAVSTSDPGGEWTDLRSSTEDVDWAAIPYIIIEARGRRPRVEVTSRFLGGLGAPEVR